MGIAYPRRAHPYSAASNSKYSFIVSFFLMNELFVKSPTFSFLFPGTPNVQTHELLTCPLFSCKKESAVNNPHEQNQVRAKKE